MINENNINKKRMVDVLGLLGELNFLPATPAKENFIDFLYILLETVINQIKNERAFLIPCVFNHEISSQYSGLEYFSAGKNGNKIIISGLLKMLTRVLDNSPMVKMLNDNTNKIIDVKIEKTENGGIIINFQ